MMLIMILLLMDLCRDVDADLVIVGSSRDIDIDNHRVQDIQNTSVPDSYISDHSADLNAQMQVNPVTLLLRMYSLSHMTVLHILFKTN